MDPAQPTRLGFEEDALAAWQQGGDARRPDVDADPAKRTDQYVFDRNGPPRAATFAGVSANVRGMDTQATNQESASSFQLSLLNALGAPPPSALARRLRASSFGHAQDDPEPVEWSLGPQALSRF